MTEHPKRRIITVAAALRDACRTGGGAEMVLLVGAVAAGLAVLFALGAVATSRPLAILAAVVLAGLAGTAVLACLLARRGRERIALILFAIGLAGAGLFLGVLFRWPLAAPYGLVLAFALLLPVLSSAERHIAIAAAIPVATIAVFLSSPDPNWPAVVMVGPLGQLGAGLVIGLILLTLERARAAVEAERSRYRSLVEEAPVGIVRVDPDGRILHANRTAAGIFGSEAPSALEGRSIVERFVDPEVCRRLGAELLTAGTVSGEVELRRLDGTRFWARYRARLWPVDGALGYEASFEDVTSERAAARAAAHLAAIVESADDAIVGLDLDGRITSWNPAAARLFGLPASTALGRRISDVLPLPQTAAEAPLGESLNKALSGQAVRSLERQVMGPEGLRTISLTISPIVGSDARIGGASLVARDVTDLRRLERQLGQVVAERAIVLDALRRIQASPSLEGTADAIARELSTTDGFASASILVFEAEGRVVRASSWVAGERTGPASTPAPRRIEELRARATGGPWVETLGRQPPGSYRAFLAERGIHHLVYAPLVLGGEPVGLLSLGLSDEDRTAAVERLPAAAEFAAVASALLGPSLEARRHIDGLRARIRAIIEERAFSIVFQPIVDLASGAVLGYEALTRFADGTPPDRVFADAAACGLGRELELASLEQALAEAAPLPANAFLDLNVSPDLVLAREPLATILRQAGWGTVLEITEHAPIADYEAFRSAVAAVGPGVRLAIDDAGAGYASLRHILELRPAFVKLDRWLVAGIDGDRSRQALVAGMVHAAERTDYVLVAEGVEREEERRTLLELGVRMGQGYLFGQPAPAETWSHAAPPERLAPVLSSVRVSAARAALAPERGPGERGPGRPVQRPARPVSASARPSGTDGRRQAVSSPGARVGRGDTPGRG
ncbi:MAG TPA: EAL domain-containing protein [Candidatus Binatia bacterium]|nr:EAL domain-containing protein [Candidatus Binatia bacterium]